MKWLFSIFEKYYPCTCKKQAAASSAALTLTLINFCNQIGLQVERPAMEIIKQKKQIGVKNGKG